MRWERLIVGAALLLAACGVDETAPPSAAPDPSAPSSASARPPSPRPSSGASSEAHPSPSAELDGLVAYVGGADPQIYLLDLGSGENRQLTHLRPEDAELTASGPLRPVLSCGFGPSWLQWAPDGRHLAFAYGGCDSVVYVADLAGTLQRIGDGRSPAWSPDGAQLAFGPNYPYLGVQADRSWPLLVVDVDGDDMTPRPLGDAPGGFYAGSPSYSPDGALVAFTGPGASAAEDPTASAAYVIGSDGADLAIVAEGSWPTGWLPDGRLIVIEPTTGASFAADLGSGQFTPVAGGDPVEAISPDGSLLLANAIGDAGNRVRLYQTFGALVGEISGFAPTWSPDGTAFLVTDVESGVLLVVGVDGIELGRYELTGPVGGDGRARWQPSVP